MRQHFTTREDQHIRFKHLLQTEWEKTTQKLKQFPLEGTAEGEENVRRKEDIYEQNLIIKL